MPNVERGTRYTIQARDLFTALLAQQIAGPAWIKFPADAAGELVSIKANLDSAVSDLAPETVAE